ncbi:MAG: hypothetical protein K5841_08750 [Fretibacterium sp.]|nr:hypothetical protein [Fretibacterium sp.]
MKKRIFSLNVAALLAAVALLGVIAGGCGGSSSSGGSSRRAATSHETTFNLSDLSSLLTMDIDGNGMPDFLDFYGVAQVHVDNSASASSVRLSGAPTLLAAAEKTVMVPTMIWLSQLRLETEGANVFSVNLEAGQEYTLEFSKNLTESLGGVLPSIKIYDPANAQKSEAQAEAMGCEIAAYPPEHPSILCYTVKPTVSGTYLVRVSNGEPSTNEDAGKMETDSVLFIYKERRNEQGETGYYTRFNFRDENGNMTESLSASDLIYLRQLILEAYPKYFEEVYGQKLLDDPSGMGGAFDIQDYDVDYARAMYQLQALLGFQVIDEEKPEDDSEDSDYELEPIGGDPSYEGKKVVIVGHAAGKVSVSAIEDAYSQIPTHVTGLPYEPEYAIGQGFMATSNFGYIRPQGGIEVDITGTWKKANQAYLKDKEDYLPLQTESYAKFVSTSTQAESLLKSTATVGMSTAAVGASMGSGTTNNLKFGLTSTNLVIHYEEVEDGYRMISAKKIAKAWQNAGDDNDLFDFVERLGKKYGKDKFKEVFRNNLGDYYVSGYQYGACYDAYISIRTETSEQTRELEKKLSAALNLGEGDDQLNVSADIGSKLTDTLKEFEATVDVKIVTNGLGEAKPVEIPTDDIDSKDIAGKMDKVGNSLAKFLTDLRNNGQDRSKYSPIRVKLTRWRQNFTMAETMMAAGDEDGLIPVTVGQMARIAGFNTRLKNLTGYKNVVGDNPDVPSAATADIETEYNTIVAAVKAGGERFYASKEDVERYQKRIDAITPKYKALADRYAFYTKLVRAQAAEKKTYDKLLAGAKASDTGSEQSRKFVRQMPFGVSGGGSSGFDSFPYSTYVTEDIDAGGDEQHKQYYKENNKNFFRRFWYETQKEGDDEYLSSAGPAVLTATAKDGSKAVFCKVRVASLSRNSETDNLRELTHGSPAVGTSIVGFNFQSGRGDHVDWNIYGKAMRMRPTDYPFKGLN